MEERAKSEKGAGAPAAARAAGDERSSPSLAVAGTAAGLGRTRLRQPRGKPAGSGGRAAAVQVTGTTRAPAGSVRIVDLWCEGPRQGLGRQGKAPTRAANGPAAGGLPGSVSDVVEPAKRRQVSTRAANGPAAGKGPLHREGEKGNGDAGEIG